MSRSALLGALCSALIVGCSDPYAGRMAVSGKVTLEGQPLSDAMIRFEPLDGQDTSSGAVVENGQYKMQGQAGLKPGKYRVRITAGDGKTPADEADNPEFDPTDPGGANIVSVDRIPPDYSERSRQEVEVKADGENRFDFAIPNARKVKPRKR